MEKPTKMFPDNPPKYTPPVPYPQRLQNLKLDQQFGMFLEVFKKLYINIPFADALAQMPSYTKFMKEILSNKRKLVEIGMVALNEECSAILQRKLHPKQKDLGSFTIPCIIGDVTFKCLCDLGASINLMPYSIFQKLRIGTLHPTRASLQFADRSVKMPCGVAQDVLVKVDKLVFLAAFVVLDMEEDHDVPIILGRPFLATGKTLIDVEKGELVIRHQDQEIKFNMFKSMKYPNDCHEVS